MAALAAMNAHEEDDLEKRRQLENALEQARFEATRAHRQYDQVDPDNRLVAGNGVGTRDWSRFAR